MKFIDAWGDRVHPCNGGGEFPWIWVKEEFAFVNTVKQAILLQNEGLLSRSFVEIAFEV
jgi:hypothetical protein